MCLREAASVSHASSSSVGNLGERREAGADLTDEEPMNPNHRRWASRVNQIPVGFCFEKSAVGRSGIYRKTLIRSVTHCASPAAKTLAAAVRGSPRAIR